MKKRLALFLTLTLVALSLGSCVSTEKFMPYQEVEKLQSKSPNQFETVFQPDDMLLIAVSAASPDIAAPYNLNASTGNDSGGQGSQSNYLVDEKGYIDFPILGRIKAAGKTKTELSEYLYKEISKDIRNPIINIRITNYKITVHGEVNNAGVHTIGTERITLPEALALSGDMTIYGNRKRVLVMREENGVRKSDYIDITKADFMNSEYYYLKQNDIVFVEQNNVRKNSAAVGPNIATIFSAVSLLATIITLAIRINN